MKKGYKKTIDNSREIRSLRNDLNTHDEICAELLKNVLQTATGHRVTAAELKRDFGFTTLSLKVLEKNKQLIPSAEIGLRKTYDLVTALNIRILQPGLTKVKSIRTVRKNSNIVTVYREILNRATIGV